MGCFAIMRGAKAEINDTPIVDGQFFIETDQYDPLDSSKYNNIYIDNNTSRVRLGIDKWSGLSKPFETINENNLEIVNNVLNAKSQSWGNIIDKPFETIGSNLSVDNNGRLKLSIEWNSVLTKPFYTIGSGLNVDSHGNLNADFATVSVTQVGTAGSNDVSYQALTINNLNTEIIGTMYMEYQRTLSTVSDTVFIFNNSNINHNRVIEVYTSIYDIMPKEIVTASGICMVTFPQQQTANINLTCRIYIL